MSPPSSPRPALGGIKAPKGGAKVLGKRGITSRKGVKKILFSSFPPKLGSDEGSGRTYLLRENPPTFLMSRGQVEGIILGKKRPKLASDHLPSPRSDFNKAYLRH
ncbi:hypothetical protein TNIN_134691 [Trichonephila inaurata madagascariensis]|uniref:Uncharacterized protein n=1 Tax=Trichonephila inaurata madagascariensis TaxID=2747483 RepID=A0A8X6YNH9_9ARAC|nr:hypothetical protein TNIN_134691 [Trichonephila inaurata madagascariensis]